MTRTVSYRRAHRRDTVTEPGRTPHPTTDEIVALLREAERLYRLGGAATATGLGAHDPDEWHGYVLAELDDVANMNPDAYARVARDWGLDNAAGVRALVRLSAARAVAASLRYALGLVDPTTGDVATAASAIDEINISHLWLRPDG